MKEQIYYAKFRKSMSLHCWEIRVRFRYFDACHIKTASANNRRRTLREQLMAWDAVDKIIIISVYWREEACDVSYAVQTRIPYYVLEVIVRLRNCIGKFDILSILISDPPRNYICIGFLISPMRFLWYPFCELTAAADLKNNKYNNTHYWYRSFLRHGK